VRASGLIAAALCAGCNTSTGSGAADLAAVAPADLSVILPVDGAAPDLAPSPDLAPPRDLAPPNGDALAACEAQLIAGWQAQRPALGFATPSAAASYDAVIGKLMDDFAVPGASVAVVQNGKLVLARAYGFADRDAPQLVNPDHRFRLASVSKQITSAAVLKLVEAGKLGLDDKAFSIISDIQPLPGKTINPQLANITVRNLLQHTGGWNRDTGPIYDPMFDSGIVSTALGQPRPATCTDTIRYMLDKPLQYTPGSTTCYSNFGYCVLGRVIERRAGSDYATAVTSSVLQPLGAARIVQGQTLQRADNEVNYYDYPGAPLVRSVFPNITAMVPRPYGGWYLEAMDSHGAWIASAVDHLRFQVGVDRRPQPPDLLSTASETAMLADPNVPSCTSTGGTTPADPNYWYGFGWSVNSSNNYWHNGSLDGTTTETVVASNGFGWTLLLNTRSSNSDVLGGRVDGDLWTAFSGTKAWVQADLFDQYTAFSGWMAEPAFAVLLADGQNTGLYPSRLEGRGAVGGPEYRAQMVPLHAPMINVNGYGLDCEAYVAEQAQLTAQGYLLINLQWYRDASGARRFQASWQKL
jgi:N-acyl-D-amino-acid deacylase